LASAFPTLSFSVFFVSRSSLTIVLRVLAEVPSSSRPSYSLHNVQMDGNWRVGRNLHAPHSPRPRLVHWYACHRLLAISPIFGHQLSDIFLCVVCYSLGIYLLNLFLAFLTPKFDPSLEQELADQETEEGTSGTLPTNRDDEFRPFIRRYSGVVRKCINAQTSGIQILAFCYASDCHSVRLYLVQLLRCSV